MPIDTVDLDHVAVAAEQWGPLWDRYGGDLGAGWVSNGEASGFAACQVRFATGMKIELLRPHAVEENDFLRRFLDRSGPGPHHLTYKVGDIVRALETVEAAGYRPVNVNLDYPEWKEAFLHPKDAPGVVVQVAQSQGDWSSDRPAEFPPPRHGATASLLRVVHAVADLDGALALFRDVLGGREDGRGDDADGTWVDLAWPGPGRVRLVRPAAGSEFAAWLDGRPGRVHHLAFACPWVSTVETVAPEENLGVRLRLHPGDVSRGRRGV